MSFEEEAMKFSRAANQCIIEANTSNKFSLKFPHIAIAISVMDIVKIKEQFEMLLILTWRTDFSPIVLKMKNELSAQIQKMPNQGKIDENAVAAATGILSHVMYL